MLNVEGLSVSFPIRKGILRRVVDQNAVLKNIRFSLRPGESLGLVGESGSGKSTTGPALLRLIASQGEILFDGMPLHLEPSADAAGTSPHAGGVSGSQLLAQSKAEYFADHRRRIARPSAYPDGSAT